MDALSSILSTPVPLWELLAQAVIVLLIASLINRKPRAEDNRDLGRGQRGSHSYDLQGEVNGLKRAVKALEKDLLALEKRPATSPRGAHIEAGRPAERLTDRHESTRPATIPIGSRADSPRPRPFEESQSSSPDEPRLTYAAEPRPAAPEPARPRIAEPQFFFAPIPEMDGTFKVSELHPEQNWEALYSLAVHSQGSATVSLCENPGQYTAAVQAPQRYLDPVCNYSKPPGPSTVSIRQLSPGLAYLESGRWHIKNKLEIEFC